MLDLRHLSDTKVEISSEQLNIQVGGSGEAPKK